MSRRTAANRICLSFGAGEDSSVDAMLDAIDTIEPRERPDDTCDAMFEEDQRDLDYLLGSLRGRPVASY